MFKKPAGRGLESSLGLLPVIVAALLLQTLFGGSLRTSTTAMTCTEFETALHAGQIQTAAAFGIARLIA
jgi:hypothetical protein